VGRRPAFETAPLSQPSTGVSLRTRPGHRVQALVRAIAAACLRRDAAFTACRWPFLLLELLCPSAGKWRSMNRAPPQVSARGWLGLEPVRPVRLLESLLDHFTDFSLCCCLSTGLTFGCGPGPALLGVSSPFTRDRLGPHGDGAGPRRPAPSPPRAVCVSDSGWSRRSRTHSIQVPQGHGRLG